MPKLAFCFLLTNKVTHTQVWDKFFNGIDKKYYNIYSHIKIVTNKIPEYISLKSIQTIPTSWCSESLVFAYANMIKEALKDKENKYFILLSGECIPLFTFNTIYNEIFSDKRSRIYIEHIDDYYYNHQWMILNLKCAKLFSNIEKHIEVLREIYYGINKHCPDEIYPIYYLLKMLNNKQFTNNIMNIPVTYVSWIPGKTHPKRFRKNDTTKEICLSKALFARKFFKNSVDNVAMKCQ
jgi:hypothetical protein